MSRGSSIYLSIFARLTSAANLPAAAAAAVDQRDRQTDGQKNRHSTCTTLTAYYEDMQVSSVVIDKNTHWVAVT